MHSMKAFGVEDCEPEPTTLPEHTQLIAAAWAAARVSCDATGTGAQSVVGLKFRSGDALTAWEDDYRNYLGGKHITGTCSGSDGQSPWADASGEIRGRIFCFYRDSSTAVVLWSDTEAKAGYYAVSAQNGLNDLIAWWAEHVRGVPSGERAGEVKIRRKLQPRVKGGLEGCKRTRSVIADAALTCGRSTVPAADTYVDYLGIYSFHDEATMDAFFKSYTSEFDGPDKRTAVYCDKAALVSATFGPEGGPATGRIFCFPTSGNGGTQWILWTVDDDLVAGLIGRADQDEHALYKAWRKLP